MLPFELFPGGNKSISNSPKAIGDALNHQRYQLWTHFDIFDIVQLGTKAYTSQTFRPLPGMLGGWDLVCWLNSQIWDDPRWFFLDQKFLSDQIFFADQIFFRRSKEFLRTKNFFRPKVFSHQNFFPIKNFSRLKIF